MAGSRQDVERRLRSRRGRDYLPATKELCELGPDAEPLLAALVVDPGVVQRAWFAAMLGDLRGAEGDAALRAVAREAGPGTRDLRCAALLALAKRCGHEATPDLIEGLQSRDTAVKDYAVVGLAGVGDDRGWPAVLERLRQVLRRGSRMCGHTEILVAVAYLGQHLDGHPQRRTKLVAELRRRWESLSEQEVGWFATFWPEAAPAGAAPETVPPPDAARLRSWVRDHPFRADTFADMFDERPTPRVFDPDGGPALHLPVQLLTDRFRSEGAPRGSVGVVVDVHGEGYDIQLIEAEGWGPLIGPVPPTELARHGP